MYYYYFKLKRSKFDILRGVDAPRSPPYAFHLVTAAKFKLKKYNLYFTVAANYLQSYILQVINLPEDLRLFRFEI